MIRFQSTGEGIKRTTNVQQPDGSRTFIFFYRPNAAPSGTYLTQLYWGEDPAVYTKYAGIFTQDSDSDKLKLYVSDGVTTEISIGAAFDVTRFKTIMYRYIEPTNSHEFWVNGVLIDTLTLDISGDTYTDIWLGDDTFSAASNHDFFGYGEWSRALTDEEAKAQFKSATLVVTDGIVAFTPLLNDPDDDSGEGNNWTEVGTEEYLGQPPQNIVPYTAIILSSLPVTTTGNANRSDNLETIPVWYQLTGPTDRKVVGAFSYNLTGAFRPQTAVYQSNGTSQLLNIAATNKPIQFPSTPGETYFLRIVPNPGGTTGDFSLSVLAHQPSAVPAGSIVVNDDSNGFPVAVLSPDTDYLVLDFFNDFAAGEAGDAVSNGNALVADATNDTVVLYDKDYNELLVITGKAEAKIRVNRILDCFYVALDASPVQAFKVSSSGVVEDSWTLTAVNRCQGMCAANDGSILFTSPLSAGGAIRRWDLVNDVALSDLCAGDGTYFVWDILMLEDDTIIALYAQNNGDIKVKQINSTTGATIQTFNFGSAFDFPSGTFPRIAYANDSPDSFWIWLHPDTSVGVSEFRNIRISDGVAINTHPGVEYEVGSYQPAVSASPIARFGHSFSCPFWIARDSAAPPPTFPGIYILTPGQPNDEYNGLQEVRIPTPFFKTYFHGE